MFHSARLKLTAWYVLIIMSISIAFSTVIYFGATHEFNRVLRMQRFRLQHPEFHLRIVPGSQLQIEPVPDDIVPDPQVIEDEEIRLLESLGGVNIIILVLSALSGYFLAGQTLRPIQTMVDEQSRFITDASHELNTPLTSIRTAVEVNLRDKKLTLAKAKDVLKSNLEEVQSLQSLSNELIRLTQYEEITGALPFTTLQLDQLIERAHNKVSTLAKTKQIHMISDVAPLLIPGDEKSITELFVILLDNAIKYSPEKTTVTISAKQLGAKAEIQVTDEGIGIDKDDLGHIFERFYRADKSRTKQHTSGYGLGLSIAKRIVTLHRGTMSVASIVNKGTTFSIVLPTA